VTVLKESFLRLLSNNVIFCANGPKPEMEIFEEGKIAFSDNVTASF
jgi:hypothetical protein